MLIGFERLTTSQAPWRTSMVRQSWRRATLQSTVVTVTSTKQFVFNGNEIAEERDMNNAVTRRFYPQGEQISGMSYFYTRDHLGSVRELTDSSGAVRARYDYDLYGVRTKLSGDLDAQFGYTGHYYHAPSGLNLALYRAYNAGTGRWLSRDPIEERGGVNLYGYVGNDPSNRTDPLGLLTITYSLSQNTMFVADLYAMDFRILSPFHSGEGRYRDNPAFQNVRDHGPIPLGDYTIFNREGMYKNTGYPGYILDPIDATPGNDICDANGRDAFRLHFGKSSIGCPTTTDRDAMEELIDMLSSSGPIRAWGPSGLIPHPWFKSGGFSYGTMRVIW